MKTDLAKIKKTLNQHKSLLKDFYGVKGIGIFGSVATNTNKENSDIDMLVEFSTPVGFFKFIELEETLTKMLGKKVDLVTKKALKPAIKEDILQETIYV